jgi:hypothetical protein
MIFKKILCSGVGGPVKVSSRTARRLSVAVDTTTWKIQGELRWFERRTFVVKLSPGQTRKHCCGNIVSYQCFAMFPRVGKHLETLVRNIGKHQMFLNLLGNIFSSREANFVSATMFPRVGKQGNIWGNIENHECFHNNVSYILYHAVTARKSIWVSLNASLVHG